MALLAFGGRVQGQTLGKDSLAGLKWRLIGPFRGGRVEAVGGVPGTDVFYFGGVAGGVWKTNNTGLSWIPMFDKEPIASIGAIAVAPSDPNVIYAGTGEPCLRSDITYGNGVYKSTDAGLTWTHIGLDDTRHIAAILVDPRDPDVVLVAAIGHAFGPNAQRGVFRSTDGGRDWQKVLYKDENTGAVDLVSDPTNPRIVYAALYQVRRLPWTFSSGGPGSGIYKSTDEGATWKQLQGHGLPAGVLGKIGLAVAAGGERIYALIEAERGGLYVSDDAGSNWRFVNGDHRFLQRAWYFLHIFADPRNAGTLYILNTGLYRSTDGGERFTPVRAPHGDNHALWIDPGNTAHMILGNDGGATISTDGGKTWSTQNNQPTAQFYHIAADTRFPYYVYGAQQDNSTVAIATRTPHGFIGREDWYSVGGGESGYIVPDPADPALVYAGSYFGILTRYDRRTEQALLISPWPDDPDGHPAAEQKYRFTWTMPIALSPHDPNVLYFASQVLFKSLDRGQSWAVISPDLTRNDPAKQGPSGGPITKDQASVEYYDLIYSVAESPIQKDLIWVGTDDGLVWLTRDGGKRWSNVTPRDLPEWSKVSLIEPSPSAAGTAYLAANRFKLDDLGPYAWKTTDFGRTWVKITDGIPDGAFMHAVKEDPKRPDLLFAATELGVYASFDGGSHWQSLKLNLPTVPVRDLVIKDNDLVIATHGRAFWSLDDLSPLRQLAATTLDEPVHLFRPAPAVRFRAPEVAIEPGESAAANPPTGVVIDYYLQSAPSDDVALEIVDAKGRMVRKFSSKKKSEPVCPSEAPHPPARAGELPKNAGINRFVWDMRYELPVVVPCAVYDEGDPLAPLALPGDYQARLTVGGKSYAAPIQIVPDPRVKAAAADLANQFDLVAKLRDLMEQDHEAVLQIRDVRLQLEALEKRVGADPQAKDILAAAEATNKKMTAVEDALIEPKATASEDELNYPVELNSKLGYLVNGVDSADSAPPKQDWDLYTLYQNQVGTLVAQWKGLVATDLVRLNQLMHRKGVPAVEAAPLVDAVPPIVTR
ncbi:MAG TPA: hypothetical protein VGS20_15345 [Candidatus Acidoferrales bacterium]|nr:hypothetical protein [Candidatus Acidoferrales bacterium]